MSMYVALYKLKTGWKIAQITAGHEYGDEPAPAQPQSDRVRRAKRPRHALERPCQSFHLELSNSRTG